jgi:hypothetical protein
MKTLLLVCFSGLLAILVSACGVAANNVGSNETGTLDCTAGQACNCGSNAHCDGDCPGGNCAINCGSNATCDMQCSGGGCSITCGSNSQCHLKSAGAKSTQVCGTGAQCTCDGCE